MDVQAIRDESLGAIAMIPLFQQHDITACNVEGCDNPPSTMIVIDESIAAGICEEHYQRAKDEGKWTYNLDLTK